MQLSFDDRDTQMHKPFLHPPEKIRILEMNDLHHVVQKKPWDTLAFSAKPDEPSQPLNHCLCICLWPY
jgi:hypothetical protein